LQFDDLTIEHEPERVRTAHSPQLPLYVE
jgi:hypothetical protein